MLATSVPTECSFKTFTDTFSKRRSLLHPEQAGKLVFVKKNLDSEDLERKRKRFTFGEKEKEDPVVSTSTSSSEAITANNCTSYCTSRTSTLSTSIASAAACSSFDGPGN